MKIQSTKRMVQGPPPSAPGVLLGVEKPSEELAEAARKTLGLDAAPQHLVIGIPPGAVPFDPMEKAILKTSESLVKMVTKELAKASGSKAAESSVHALWLGVNLWRLYGKWEDPQKNVPGLLIDTASTALGAVDFALDATGTPNAFFDDDVLQNNLEMLFTSSKAVASGTPISTALLNRRFAATDVGKVANLFTPLLQAAADTDPAFDGIQFKPFPSISATSAFWKTEA